jgi:hypothetical protein
MKKNILFITFTLICISISAQRSSVIERFPDGAKKMVAFYEGEGNDEMILKTIYFDQYCSGIPAHIIFYNEKGTKFKSIEFFKCSSQKKSVMEFNKEKYLTIQTLYDEDESVHSTYEWDGNTIE